MDTTTLLAEPGRAQTTRTRRPLYFAAAAVGLALIALFGVLGGLRAARAGTALPGVTVAGVDVGGLGGEALRSSISAAGLGDRQITARLQDRSVTATGEDVGYRLDVAATEAAVLRRGRQLNPLAALADHIQSFRGPIPVPPIHEIDGAALDAWVAATATELSTEPTEGDLVIQGTTVTRVDPVPGAEVAEEDLREQVLAALVGDGERDFEVKAASVAPETTAADVDEIVALAERAVSAPVTLQRNDGSLSLSGAEIGELLTVVQDGATLELAVEVDALDERVPADLRARFETDPEDARITISGGAVTISESQDGFRFDAERAAEQLLEVATGEGERTAELDGEILEPELSTADAEALEVVEAVSSFTTHFSCCQSRVQNIHRIAELVDGVLIQPGETFSVNGHVGRRTRENGFTDGGAIQNGEFVEQVGGGVSQFATTMYNAAFFGGYAIPQHKAHSYYISRYPVGREATLNYPDVDLKVRNDSPYGLVVKTSVTPTSVTVTFWGKKWVEVSDITGERRNVKPPPTRVRDNPAMPAGSERVVQSGREGFDITVVRVLVYPDGREEREEIFTRYLPEPRIVERGTASSQPAPPPPSEEPTPAPQPEPSPAPPADDGNGAPPDDQAAEA